MVSALLLYWKIHILLASHPKNIANKISNHLGLIDPYKLRVIEQYIQLILVFY